MSARRVAVAAMLAATALTSQAPIVQTVIANGTTQSRYDMVILGDGYRASEQATFDQDVNTFLTALFQREPFQTFSAYYNVHTVFRASTDSGADRPDETPPVFVDTAYEATYDFGGTARCLYIQNTSQALADAALAPATEGRVLVLVNDDRYGGCASTFAVSYNGSQMVQVQAHELGHSLGQLADEYDSPNATYTGGEPAAVNITTSPTGDKWQHWHGTAGIGAFEGAGYHEFGLFRPRINCLMRSLGQVLCRVCQENITRITNGAADVIIDTVPPTENVIVATPTLETFSFAHFVPSANLPLIEWRLDGVLDPSVTDTTFVLDSLAVGLGSHTLEARVIDQSDRVRADPNGTMIETHTWQVTVSDPSLAQLRFTAFEADTSLVEPGGSITLTPTVQNDGPAAAGAFAVEFFHTVDPAWSTQDTLLGRIEWPGLAVGSATSSLTVSLPWELPSGLSRIFAVVDRIDAVAENDESDNETQRFLFGSTGTCPTGLEFRDPLVTPRAGSLSLADGGVLHPTVVAPCADPTTTLYLIAWSGSGTSPGVPLAPGVTLSLNPDSLTQIGLNGLNGPVFVDFLGILDNQGIGRATFALPPTTALATGTTHFATVLLGATELFAAASNPIALDILP